MDSSKGPDSPQWLCVWVYVLVCVHLYVNEEDITKCLTAPSSPPPVCALPSRQPYVKSHSVPRGSIIYLTCPALEI